MLIDFYIIFALKNAFFVVDSSLLFPPLHMSNYWYPNYEVKKAESKYVVSELNIKQIIMNKQPNT